MISYIISLCLPGDEPGEVGVGGGGLGAGLAAALHGPPVQAPQAAEQPLQAGQAPQQDRDRQDGLIVHHVMMTAKTVYCDVLGQASDHYTKQYYLDIYRY